MRGPGDAGRSKLRVRKTISIPDDLMRAIEEIAERDFDGDFNWTVLVSLAQAGYYEAEQFVRSNTTTWKHSVKHKR